MPVDLDAPISVIPCGVPGDLDALSGRAHICPDRTRIAVTECVPFEPGECEYCIPGTVAARYLVTLHDFVSCEGCHWYGVDERTYRLSFLDGSPYSIPLLQQVAACRWHVAWGLVRWEHFWYADCQGVPSQTVETPFYAELLIYGPVPGLRLKIGAGPWDMFTGHLEFGGLPDCRVFSVPNEHPPVCRWSDEYPDAKWGHGGFAEIQAR